MDRSNVVVLIGETISTDENYIQQATETRTEVYCDIQSVSQNEFFKANELGFKPQFKITMFKYDYDGESIIEVDGVRYSIYRTFEGRNDTLELYCEKKVGI